MLIEITEENIIRNLAANTDAFDSWYDKKEDIYQDYLNHAN